MKKHLFFFPILFGSISILLTRNNTVPTSSSLQRTKVEEIISCAPPGNENSIADKNGKFITVLPGWGKHFYAISTQNDSAQIYFNQGLSMYYSYHAREAIASFKEAAKFDSSCAMIYWGQALAMGPPYNFNPRYKVNAGIYAILKKMNENADKSSAKEQDLIQAMSKRYSATDTADRQRKELDALYAEALKPLVAKYPDDPDIKAFYTDAVMLVHPWDFWNNDGTAKSWTPELVQHCEEILKQNPQHPAGLHYYIHVTEASRQPQVALASADSLIKLFPGVAHMVHMSSHEYERNGVYAKGVEANEAADNSLELYDSLAKGLFPAIHSAHYFAVETFCALSGAMYKKAVAKAKDIRSIVEPTHESTYEQYLYMFPLLAMVRTGNWQDIINDNSPVKPEWSYAGLLNDFSKGMAFAHTGNHAEAEKYLQQLREKMNDAVLRVKFRSYMSSAYECALVAENILSAVIYFNEKKYKEAITTIQKAVVAEDSLLYTEPKIWMMPARQYLGAFLLKLKKPKEAEKIYREDLIWNPGNGWSLLGLHQSLKAQQKTKELKTIKALYIQSFSEADKFPVSSAY